MDHAAIKKLYIGATGSGKTSHLKNEAMRLLECPDTKADKVLVLLPDSGRRDNLRKKLPEIIPFQPTIVSLSSFIRNDFAVYYPLVLSNCKGISARELWPFYMNSEAAEFILFKVIDKRRETEYLFSPVVSDSMQIAAELAKLMLDAVNKGMSFESLAQRLKVAASGYDNLKQQIFNDAEIIIKAYITKCMELGVFDTAVINHLYYTYLLPDDKYITLLGDRYDHILGDCLEEFPAAAVPLLKTLIKNSRTSIFTYNRAAASALLGNTCRNRLEEWLFNCFECIELKGSYTCSPDICNFAVELENSINNVEINKVPKYAWLEKYGSFELRSEMVEAAGERLIKLVKEEGVRPSEIAVLSTYADRVTGYVLEQILNKAGIKFLNLSKKEMVYENLTARNLITFARLCYPSLRLYPGRDNVRILLDFLFGLNPVSCAAAADYILKKRPAPGFPEYGELEDAGILFGNKKDRYEFVRLWAEEYTLREVPLADFFKQAFMEVFLSDKYRPEEIAVVKNIISRAENFTESMARFGRNGTRDFLEFAGLGRLSLGYFHDMKKDLEESIVMMAPWTALSSQDSFKAIILLSASSKNWLPPSGGGISNKYLLEVEGTDRAVKETGEDEILRRRVLASTISCLLKKCSEKLIVFESDLSANGFENDGILSACIDQVLEG